MDRKRSLKNRLYTDAFGAQSKAMGYTSVPEREARKRFAAYLATLSEANVERVYNECVAAGRRAGANLAAIEYGKRLEKKERVHGHDWDGRLRARHVGGNPG